MPQTNPIPVWPRIEAVTRPDGTGELTINGTSHPIETTSPDDARDAILERITTTAAKIGRSVRVATTGPEGDWPLIVHPDGTVEEDPDGTPRPRAVEGAIPAHVPAPKSQQPIPPAPAQPTLVQPNRPAMTGLEKALARLETERAAAGRPGELR